MSALSDSGSNTTSSPAIHSALGSSELADPGFANPGLASPGFPGSGRESSAPGSSAGLDSSGWDAPGLGNPGLTDTGPAGTGLTGTGLADTGLTSTGSAGAAAVPVQGGSSDRSFRVQVGTPEPGVILLRASGTLDLAAEPRFAEPVRQHLAAPADLFVLDVSGVEHLDTAAAVTMLEATHRARLAGAALRVVSSPAVDELLTRLDLAHSFSFTGSLGEAIAEVRGEPARAE